MEENDNKVKGTNLFLERGVEHDKRGVNGHQGERKKTGGENWKNIMRIKCFCSQKIICQIQIMKKNNTLLPV